MTSKNTGTRGEVTIRRATAADFDLTFEIKKAAGGQYIQAVFGWDEGVEVGFHRKQFVPQNTNLILLDGRVVGWISVSEHEDYVKISELYVLPGFQNQGVGTFALLVALEHARGRALPVRIRVFKINDGAIRLYERLGFRKEREDGPFLQIVLPHRPEDRREPIA
jgi:ribosomal protein S18 acetylase RimI-like enzyme